MGTSPTEEALLEACLGCRRARALSSLTSLLRLVAGGRWMLVEEFEHPVPTLQDVPGLALGAALAEVDWSHREHGPEVRRRRA